jgi:hypothetical protein
MVSSLYLTVCNIVITIRAVSDNPFFLIFWSLLGEFSRSEPPHPNHPTTHQSKHVEWHHTHSTDILSTDYNSRAEPVLPNPPQPHFTPGSKLHHGARRKPRCWIVRLERGKGLWCGVVMMVGEVLRRGTNMVKACALSSLMAVHYC